jgi:hypothetical protein
MMALRDWFHVPHVDSVLEQGMFAALEELQDHNTGFEGPYRLNPLSLHQCNAFSY